MIFMGNTERVVFHARAHGALSLFTCFDYKSPGSFPPGRARSAGLSQPTLTFSKIVWVDNGHDLDRHLPKSSCTTFATLHLCIGYS